MNTLNKNLSFKSAVSLATFAMLCQAATLALATEPPPIDKPKGHVNTVMAAEAKPGPAGRPVLTNLKPASPTGFVAEGNKLCPNQPYYLYSGGNPDNFALPADPAYPSPNLVGYVHTLPTVAYDVPMHNASFRDSFNLQNTRSVCHAVIQFATRTTGDIPSNDLLTMGHVDINHNWSKVAWVTNPGTGAQTYAFDATGLNLLSQLTGAVISHLPADSVFDVFLEDDTMIDFFRMFVWYGPPRH